MSDDAGEPAVKYRVARGGLELGEFDLDNIPALLAKGQLALTDHYWAPGMLEWGILSDIAVKSDDPKADGRKVASNDADYIFSPRWDVAAPNNVRILKLGLTVLVPLFFLAAVYSCLWNNPGASQPAITVDPKLQDEYASLIAERADLENRIKAAKGRNDAYELRVLNIRVNAYTERVNAIIEEKRKLEAGQRR
jgi:hypothetical protein